VVEFEPITDFCDVTVKTAAAVVKPRVVARVVVVVTVAVTAADVETFSVDVVGRLVEVVTTADLVVDVEVTADVVFGEVVVCTVEVVEEAETADGTTIRMVEVGVESTSVAVFVVGRVGTCEAGKVSAVVDVVVEGGTVIVVAVVATGVPDEILVVETVDEVGVCSAVCVLAGTADDAAAVVDD
jgi:hypothetical protein